MDNQPMTLGQYIIANNFVVTADDLTNLIQWFAHDVPYGMLANLMRETFSNQQTLSESQVASLKIRYASRIATQKEANIKAFGNPNENKAMNS